MTRAQWSFGDDVPEQIDTRDDSELDPGLRSGLRPGETFDGQYLIEGTIGEGGMGRVLSATDRATGQRVAIKVLRRALTQPQLARFAREGQLTAGFQHPGIVRVFGGGLTEHGLPFLVLELLEDAQTLTQAWDARPDEKLDLLLEVILAVAYAHRCGIVHRDLKPDNVLVPADGRPRVCDFGLAWQSGVTDLTKTGQLLGTPLYMAPERFQSHNDLRDPSLDVWSLGVMLYQALTGSHPIRTKRGNLLELAALAANTTIDPPSALNPAVRPELDAVCLRALAREPRDRFPDAGALADALEPLLLERRTTAPPSRALPLLAGALLSLCAVLVVVAVTLQTEPPAQVVAGVPNPTPAGEQATLDAPDPATLTAARERLALLLRRARTPRAFEPEIVTRFEALESMAEGDPALRRRITLDRLGYLFRRGRWTEVLEPLALLSKEPSDDLADEATVLLALALYEIGRRSDGARACRRRLNRTGAQERPWSLTVAAWERVLDRQPLRALRLTNRALVQAPDLVEARLAAACAHGLLLEIDQAQVALARLQRTAADHPTVYRLRIACSLHLGERDRAIAQSERLISLLEPQPPASVVLDYASLLYGKRDFVRAHRAIDRVLLHDPNTTRALFLRSVIRIDTQESVEPSLQALRRLRQKDPAAFERLLGMLDPLAFRQKIRGLLGP